MTKSKQKTQYTSKLSPKPKTSSKQPRKQRRSQFNLPYHQRRKFLASHLEGSLIEKYDVRAVPVVKGDIVKIMRGQFRGHEGRVVSVDTTHHKITVDKVTIPKADGTQIAKAIDPSNVLITKLNLEDPWRRRNLERSAEGLK